MYWFVCVSMQEWNNKPNNIWCTRWSQREEKHPTTSKTHRNTSVYWLVKVYKHQNMCKVCARTRTSHKIFKSFVKKTKKRNRVTFSIKILLFGIIYGTRNTMFGWNMQWLCGINITHTEFIECLTIIIHLSSCWKCHYISMQNIYL